MKNDLGKEKKVGYIICEMAEYHFALIKDLSRLLSYRNKNKMYFCKFCPKHSNTERIILEHRKINFSSGYYEKNNR